jgi:hypothetical protein
MFNLVWKDIRSWEWDWIFKVEFLECVYTLVPP